MQLAEHFLLLIESFGETKFRFPGFQTFQLSQIASNLSVPAAEKSATRNFDK